MLLGITAFLDCLWWDPRKLTLLTLVYSYIGKYGYMRNGGNNWWCIYSGIGGMVSKGVSEGEIGEMDRIASISCS